MKSRWIPLALVAAPMLAAMTMGATWGFPVFDDAYFLMSLREGAPAGLMSTHPDRPLYGALLVTVARAFGRSQAPYVALTLGFWALLAWQTHRLWRRLFPERAELSFLVGTLAASPLLVGIQFTTVTSLFPVVLPVILGLASLLSFLQKPSGRPPEWALAATLTAAAVLVSEYGIATAAAATALLLALSRPRSAASVALGASVGYFAFRFFADISARPKVEPMLQFRRALESPWRSLSRWLSGLWYTVAGAYGETISEIRLDASQPSTWVALFAGAVAAAGAFLALRPSDGESIRLRERRFLALLLAVGAGLGVVVLANSSPVSLDPYRSRYRLPAVPFAVAATVVILDRIVGPRFRRAAHASLAFLAAWAMTTGAFEARREQRVMDDIGGKLLPLVRESDGLVIAVIPQDMLGATDLTPKVTRRWSDEDSRRALVMARDEAREWIGARLGCQSPARVDLPLDRVPSVRRGELSRLVWVSLEPGPAAPEPYCVSPSL